MATKQEILDYCTYTPHNTNRHVLSTMLDEFGNSDAPTGTINITQNGDNINIAQYATANVAVEGGGIPNLYTCHFCDMTYDDDYNVTGDEISILFPQVILEEGDDDSFNITGVEIGAVEKNYEVGETLPMAIFLEGNNYFYVIGEITSGYKLVLEDGEKQNYLMYDSITNVYYLNITENMSGNYYFAIRLAK